LDLIQCVTNTSRTAEWDLNSAEASVSLHAELVKTLKRLMGKNVQFLCYPPDALCDSSFLSFEFHYGPVRRARPRGRHTFFCEGKPLGVGAGTASSPLLELNGNAQPIWLSHNNNNTFTWSAPDNGA
jgi:hypothetical protein